MASKLYKGLLLCCTLNNYYFMTITATYTSHLSGIATGLPTELNSTLYITEKGFATVTAVVCGDCLDAVVPDTSK